MPDGEKKLKTLDLANLKIGKAGRGLITSNLDELGETLRYFRFKAPIQTDYLYLNIPIFKNYHYLSFQCT
ncbi:MAG TPA: hypothetical protein VJ208_02780 [Candidatus Nanoarchaeia archaeon]|nr:hypothetical protein [Candidatus Nanoarchaeia archaeon]